MKTEKCRCCRGAGVIFQHGGYTKADHKQCPRCHGSGSVPEGSQKKAKTWRDYNKHQEMDGLKNVEAV